MKTSIAKTFLVILSIGIINKAKANTVVKVPARITTVYSTAYPQPKLKDWKLAKEGYKAELKLNHKRYTVVYTPDGMSVRIETQLNRTKEVAVAVKNAMRKGKFASFILMGSNRLTQVMNINM